MSEKNKGNISYNDLDKEINRNRGIVPEFNILKAMVDSCYLT